MGFIKKTIFLIISVVVLLLGVLIFNEVEFNVQVIELPPEANAKCLDGSNYKFQFVPGSGEGINKFLFFFEGGGFCGGLAKTRSTIESCRQRALKPYGQSIGRFSFTLSRFQNFFSNKKNMNPLLHNWNKINVHYCDGLLHVSNGDRDGLFIRGLNNTLGIIDYLAKNKNFINADSVIVSGFSAGGMASLLYANYINGRTTKPNNTFVIADSGYLLNIAEKTNTTYLFPPILSNVIRYSGDNDLLLKTYCPYDSEEERWKCLSPEHIISQVKVPILLVQNLYDSWMIDQLGEAGCYFNKKFTENCSGEEMKIIRRYGTYTLDSIRALVKGNSSISAWIPNTIGHVFTLASNALMNRNYAVNNITLMEMIMTWYENVSKGKSMTFEQRFVTTTNEDNLHKYKDIIHYIVVYKLFQIGGFHY